MKTTLGELVKDVTEDKAFYEKFINEDLVQAAASPAEKSNVKREITRGDEFQYTLLNAFLSANTTNYDASITGTLSKRSGWDPWRRSTDHSISIDSYWGLRDWLWGNSNPYSNGVTKDLCTGGNVRSCLTWSDYIGQLRLGTGGDWVNDAGPLWDHDRKYSAKTIEKFDYQNYKTHVCISDRIEGC